MNNKILFAPVAFLLLALTTFISCGDDNDFREVSVTAVEKLYEPIDERHVELKAAAGASIYFEWERAIAEDRSFVYYDVLFDKEGGDFSDPVYIVTAGNFGVVNGVSINHKTLNTIAGRCGIPNGEQGKFIWTVQSSRGLTKNVSNAKNILSVKRLDGIDLPEAGLYITGPASETGDNLDDSLEFREVEDGVFEIYTKLEANENFIIYSGRQEIIRTFTLNMNDASFKDTKLAPGENKFTKTGIYKIRLDFLTGGFETAELQNIAIFNCASEVSKNFTYTGKGLFELIDYNVELGRVSWGDGYDERYFFVYTIDGNEYLWGRTSNKDGRPGLDEESYFELESKGLHTFDQWGKDPFKFANELIDPTNLSRYTVDISVHMTAEGPYTHKFENVRD